MEDGQIYTVIISAASLLLSVVSVILAIVSFRRSKIFQEHEYAVRLQVTNEQAIFGNPASTKLSDRAIGYFATIENRGLKPVRIDRIYLDYGS